MAGWALRVSDRAASPDSRTSITSQPRISDARTNGQPAGSPDQGAPLFLAIRPWPGKVKAIFSTGKGSYVGGVANKYRWFRPFPGRHGYPLRQPRSGSPGGRVLDHLP